MIRSTSVLALVLLLGASVCAARQIMVDSTADSGVGTLRWALKAAQPGNTIAFDPAIFPPEQPSTIRLRSGLVIPWPGGLTIDASDAGVILDGTHVPLDAYGFNFGLLVPSDNNVVMGLQIVGVLGAGIGISGGHNTIGGDRSVGAGPTGQGNLVSGSGTGIILWDVGEENRLLGNLVGTYADGVTPWGNQCRGIWIENGAPNTCIGPDNVVAFNGCAGIEINGVQAFGNTITRNSIHSNSGSEIHIWDGANAGVDPPQIEMLDVDSGLIGGTSCPHCTVEVFSDANGMTFELSTVANAEGSFVAQKDTALSGKSLLATATSPGGTTSSFSAAASVSAWAVGLQAGNSSPKHLLATRTPVELQDNHVGGSIGNWNPDDYGVAVYESLLASVRDMGIKWVRTNFCSPNPLNWQEVLQGPDEYHIDPETDDFITQLVQDGVNVVLTLSHGAGLDEHKYGEGCWGNPGEGVLGDREPERWFATQSGRDAFCAYAHFMVEHFRGRVAYYEIWNEPSSGDYPADCRGAISVRDYALLLQQVVPTIRAADPEARVIAGAIGRFNERERDWLLDLLRLGIGPLVDGLSWHPFYGNSPGQGTDGPGYWEEYPPAVRRFMDQARALGFTGEYFVDEMVWRTPADLVPTERPLYTDQEAAKYAARAIVIHAGLGFTGAGNQLLMPGVIKLVPRCYVIKNLANALAGASPADFAFEIDIAYTPISEYGFGTSTGGYIVAVWKDGEASDYDPGTPATVTLPGIVAHSVTGIDTLNGLQQELVFEVDDSGTIIRGLLVKDYPILILLSD